MKKTLIVLLCIISIPVFAQGGNLDLPTAYIRNTLSGANNLPNDVVGSVYINDKFQPGKVQIDDKAFDAFIRYNAYKDEFEIQNQAGEITTVLRRDNVVVQMGPETYEIYSFIDEDGNKRQGYLQKMNEGKNLLLVRKNIELIPRREATSTYSMDQPPKLELETQYFIKVSGKPAEPIRLKKKDILRLIPDEDFKEYVKENDLKLKDESEIIQALNALQ